MAVHLFGRRSPLFSGSRDKSRRVTPATWQGCHPEISGTLFAAEGRDQRGVICLENTRMNRFALISPLPSLRLVGRNDIFRQFRSVS
jgi:hypothetical protein